MTDEMTKEECDQVDITREDEPICGRCDNPLVDCNCCPVNVIKEYYPLAERPTETDLEPFGPQLNPDTPDGYWQYPCRPGLIGLIAISTNETRCPNYGEWYASEHTAKAYRARGNYRVAYKILKLVMIKTELLVTQVSRTQKG